MKNLKLTIEKIDNGYILNKNGYSFEGNGYSKETEVIEMTTSLGENEDDEEQRAMTKLLEKIAIFFGITYNCFSGKNLNIQWNLKGYEV